jgi:hypothetical protein
MNFSSNTNGAPLAMNVTHAADGAFLAELKRTDRARYDRLLVAMQKAAYRAQRERRCEQCNLVLPTDLRRDAKYCDSTCERNARRAA